MGKLIIFEGVEGCGKTTQVNLTREWLQSLGVEVVVTREPGGTELGVKLRQILLESPRSTIVDRAELLLYAADRAQHVDSYLKPLLNQGKIVLCDRFVDSTIAYQGFGRKLDLDLIAQLNAIATQGLERDLVLWLDIDPAIGLQRKAGNRDQFDRIEQEKLDFHYRIRQGYQHQAASYPQIIHRLDANFPPESIQTQIQALIKTQINI